MGQKYLKYQESYILESLAGHLEGNEKLNIDKTPDMLYDFRGLKCTCQAAKLP
jgi:hypothetical protein